MSFFDLTPICKMECEVRACLLIVWTQQSKTIASLMGEIHEEKSEALRLAKERQAVHQGQERAAHLLLDRGANPSIAGTDGITPLMAAAAKNFLRLLRMLRAMLRSTRAARSRDR